MASMALSTLEDLERGEEFRNLDVAITKLDSSCHRGAQWRNAL